MKVMVLTPYLPHARIGHGGGTAVRDLITWLARKHDVLVASLLRPGEEDLVADVTALGAPVAALPFTDLKARGLSRVHLLLQRSLAMSRALGSGYPLYVEKYWQPELVRRLLHIAADFAPDVIQIEYLQLALLCRELQRRRQHAGQRLPRLVLNSHELGSVPRERRARNATNPAAKLAAQLEAGTWRKLQVAATHWADTTLCVTPEDQALYAAMGGRNLVTVPLGMDTAALQADWSPAPPERYLFVGSFGHRPNRLAAAFLLDRVLPVVAAARPDAQLILAGRGSREFLAAHHGPSTAHLDRVTATGFVADLGPLFRECRLFVAPLPEGGGIKIKILEAMARGIPVVTTPVGAEGITTAADRTLTITPCDESFAAAVLDTVADPARAAVRADRARRHIVDHFSWDAITDRLTSIYESL